MNECPVGNLRNPASGRCVHKDGPTGRQLQARARNAPTATTGMTPGGWVKYEVVKPDGSVLTRNGGILKFVDRKGRFLKLINPMAKKEWSVQLKRPRGETLRLFFRAQQPYAKCDY